jgi:hypothetical protein
VQILLALAVYMLPPWCVLLAALFVWRQIRNEANRRLDERHEPFLPTGSRRIRANPLTDRWTGAPLAGV